MKIFSLLILLVNLNCFAGPVATDIFEECFVSFYGNVVEKVIVYEVGGMVNGCPMYINWSPSIHTDQPQEPGSFHLQSLRGGDDKGCYYNSMVSYCTKKK